jgi:hypothetical protein
MSTNIFIDLNGIIMHKLIIVSLLMGLTLTLASCLNVNTNSDESETTSKSESLSKLAHSLKTKASCEEKKGEWKKVGMAQIFACILPTSDSGKTCTDGSQCQVACIIKGQKVPTGNKATGQCHSSTRLFGCHAYVNNGKAEGTLCID